MKKKPYKDPYYDYILSTWGAISEKIKWICGCNKKHTKACRIKTRKEQEKLKREAIKEKKRRAKKITMTVGEYEDKIEDAKDYYREDY